MLNSEELAARSPFNSLDRALGKIEKPSVKIPSFLSIRMLERRYFFSFFFFFNCGMTRDKHAPLVLAGIAVIRDMRISFTARTYVIHRSCKRSCIAIRRRRGSSLWKLCVRAIKTDCPVSARRSQGREMVPRMNDIVRALFLFFALYELRVFREFLGEIEIQL